MFNLNSKTAKEFSKIYEQTKLIRSTTDIFYQNIKMLHYMRTKYVTSEIYNDLFDGILADIELVSSPIDTVIPNAVEFPEVDGELQIPDDYQICVLNDVVPEYERISKRVTVDDIKNNTELSHPLNMAVTENPANITTIIDEVFKFWLIRRYFVQIELLHMNQLSIMTPIIEYTVQNITEKDLKNHITSKKINKEKALPKLRESIFLPDLGRMKVFYNEDHTIVPMIDVENLLLRLMSNLTLNSDIYIISAIYHTLSFAMNDFAKHEEDLKANENGNVELSECEKYVVEVLSKI